MKRDKRHDQTSARVALVRLLTSLYILVEIYINIYLAMSWFVSGGGIKNSAVSINTGKIVS